MTPSESRNKFYRLFLDKKSGLSLLDYLNAANCDEIFQLDLKTGATERLYHVDGKYQLPHIEGSSYKEIFEFVKDSLVHPDDKKTFVDLMDPATMEEKLHDSPLRHFRYAHFRYRLQDGGWRYVEQCLLTGKENGLEEGVVRFYIFDIQNMKNREKGKNTTPKRDVTLTRDPLTGLLPQKEFPQ